MQLTICRPSKQRLAEILAWLQQEESESGEGFYCNRNIIAESFADRTALCALLGESVVAFSVFFISPPCSGVSIVEVHPQFRRRGFGKQIMTATVERLRRRGAQYVHAKCASCEGEVLCRSLGFSPYVDPRNSPGAYRHREFRLVFGGLPQGASSAA